MGPDGHTYQAAEPRVRSTQSLGVSFLHAGSTYGDGPTQYVCTVQPPRLRYDERDTGSRLVEIAPRLERHRSATALVLRLLQDGMALDVMESC